MEGDGANSESFREQAGPIAKQLQRACHDTLPWLISVSLGGFPRIKLTPMSRYIALLRAINVGRGRTVKMESLRQLFESLGFAKVATFIASGNVVFEATTKNVRLLEKKIEKRVREALGYEVAVFIRTDAELAEIAKYKPFQQSKIETATEFNVIFLANTLDEKFKQK